MNDSVLEQLKLKYFRKDKNGELIEHTPEEMYRRVAKYIASAEDRNQDTWEDIFFNLMKQGYFLPNSPTLMNAGTDIKSLSACFIVDIEDSRKGIGQTLVDSMEIFASGGGVGFPFSKLRPKGDLVSSTGGCASGPVSFAEMYNAMTSTIAQGGRRRGASMGTLSVTHPDILEFITVKRDKTKLTNFNLSVLLTDDFMQAAKDHKIFWAKDPKTQEDRPYNLLDGTKGPIEADELLRMIIKGGWTDGEPGVLFIDNAQKANHFPYENENYRIIGCNPCSEFIGRAWESCTLGSINLTKFVIDKEFDFNSFKTVVYDAIRFLDNVVTLSEAPVDKIRQATLETRKIGLGTMGLHDALLMMELPYSLSKSERTRQVVNEIYSNLSLYAVNASQCLAGERGVFPAWEDSIFSDHDIPMRNANVLSVAPTGTLARICGVSFGIEPNLFYSTTHNLTDIQYTEVHPLAKTFLDLDVPLPDFFEEAGQITPEDHIDMQILVQKYVDMAISKCLAKGTLIPTSEGIIKIDDFSNNREPDTFTDISDKNIYIDGNLVTQHYCAGVLQATRISLNNGASITGATKTHKVLTTNGWKTLENIQIGDYLIGKFYESHGQGSLPMEYNGSYRTNANQISIPRHMSNNFAKWLGMITADGSTTESSGCVCLTTGKDSEEVRTEYDSLVVSLFGILPKRITDNRNGVINQVITSRNLVRFVEELIGKGAYNKRVPQQILQGSKEEKINYLNGLTLDGHLIKDSGLCVCSTMSKELSEAVAEVCRSFGLPKVYSGKKTISYNGNTSYYVTISNELMELIEPVELHKRSKTIYKQFKVFVSDDELNNFWDNSTTSREYHNCTNGYSCVRNIRRENRNHALSNGALNAGFSIDIPVFEVTSVEDAGLIEMFDIEVANSHSYIVAGVVSHNTINLPASTQIEDLEKLYWRAWEGGLKGFTVYRDGSREGQPISNTKEDNPLEKVSGKLDMSMADSTNVVVSKERERTDIMFGPSYKVKTPEGSVYIDIHHNQKEEVCEIMLQLGDGFTDTEKALANWAARLMSKALQHGIDYDEIVKQGASTEFEHKSRAYPGRVFWFGTNGKKRAYRSIPEVASDLIIQEVNKMAGFDPEYDEEEPTLENMFTIVEETNYKEDVPRCPTCGKALQRIEGCLSCACGYSRCG